MSVSFQDLQEVLSLDDRDEFLIYQNSSRRNKRVKRGNLFGSQGIVVRGQFIDQQGNDVGLAAATATNNAAVALVSSNGAQTSANGKNQIFYSTTSPTPTAVFTGSISGTTLTVTAVISGTITVGKVITNESKSILTGTTITAFVSGVNGGAGQYTLSLSNPTIGSGTIYSGFIYYDLWFDTDGGYRMAKWEGSSWVDYGLETQAIANLDAGKITAGFIGAQTVAINGSNAGGVTGTSGIGGYIESTNFVPTWVSGVMTVRQYTTSGTSGNNLGKYIASDVVQVKVLQTDGSYKLFRSKVNQGVNATNAPPTSGFNDYWTEITGGDIPTFSVPITTTESKSIQNFGFRIASNGFAEFAGGLFRGAIISNEGFFGTTVNAVRLDSSGLAVGNLGRIKSAGIGYDGVNFFATAGEGTTSGGFFLGNTQAQGQDPLFQFFIGKPTGNNLRWDGKNLRVNARILGVGDADATKDYYGITIGTAYGIRTTANNKVLTISAGSENGIQHGAQIDLVGSRFDTDSGDDGNGALILQAAYNATSGFNTDGGRDGAIEFRTSYSSTKLSTAGTDLIYTDVGLTRMAITKKGLVYIGINPNEEGAKEDGGNLRVLSNIQVGGYSPYNLINAAHGSITIKGGQNIENVTRMSLNGEHGEILIYNADEELKIKLSSTSGEIQASSYKSTSSKRFKKKIKNLKNGLGLVNSLRPVTFEWKNENGFNDIGLIAEEVNEILPMVIAKNDKGEISGLDYGRLTPILIQAVKELSAEINALKIKINHARPDKL